MNAAEQKKAKILALLILIAGLTWYLVYRLSPETPAIAAAPPATQKPGTPGKSASPSTTEASIRLDLLNEAEDTANAGSRNLFQYRPKPVPPPKPAPPPPVYVPPPQPMVSSGPPPPPPPPPFRAFRYESWINRNGKMTAQLTEGNNIYQAVEGEVLLGQYKIVRLNENLIEIEDLALKRRQTFPKVQQ